MTPEPPDPIREFLREMAHGDEDTFQTLLRLREADLARHPDAYPLHNQIAEAIDRDDWDTARNAIAQYRKQFGDDEGCRFYEQFIPPI